MLDTTTGIGGGKLRDLLLGLPVSWTGQPATLFACLVVSAAVFFTAHIPQSRYRYLLRLDALGLALFAVAGAEKALQAGASPLVAIVMGVVTAPFGGVIHDLLGGGSPAILSREINASAAGVSAAVFVTLTVLGDPCGCASGIGFAVALIVRAASV